MRSVLRIDRNDLESIARRQLEEEFTAACNEGPEATVSTPEWRTSRSTVAEVIACDLSDDSPDLLDLLRIVSNGRRGADVTLACQAWHDRAAKRHAKRHAPDVARELAADANEGRTA